MSVRLYFHNVWIYSRKFRTLFSKCLVFFFSLNVALKRHIYGNTKNHQNFFPFFFFTKDRLVNSKVFVWMRQIKPPVSQCVSWYTATTSVEKKNWCSTDCSPWGKSVFRNWPKTKIENHIPSLHCWLIQTMNYVQRLQYHTMLLRIYLSIDLFKYYKYK